MNELICKLTFLVQFYQNSNRYLIAFLWLNLDLLKRICFLLHIMNVANSWPKLQIREYFFQICKISLIQKINSRIQSSY